MSLSTLHHLPQWADLSTRLSQHHLQLRLGHREDAAAIQQVVFGCLTEYGLPLDPQQTDADLSDVDHHYNNRQGLFVVIEDANAQLLGTAGIYDMGSRVCELRKMYFSPALRGLGIGKRLVVVLMQWAKSQGFERMTLETATVLKEAVALYQHLGFEPYTPDHAVSRCDQAWQIAL